MGRNARNGKKVLSFNEQSKTIFLLTLAFGSYPPLSGKYLDSSWSRWLFYLIGFIPSGGCYIYAAGLVWYIFDNPGMNTIIMIQLIRRAIIMFFSGTRVFNHLFRYKKTDRVFQEWEDSVNDEYMADERREMMKEEITMSRKIACSGMFLRFFMSVLYNIPFLLNRYARSSNIAGLPHDNTSPYHFNYVAFQFILFCWINLTLPSCELYPIYLYTMGAIELKVLRKKLDQIVSVLDTNQENDLLYKSPKGLVSIDQYGATYKAVAQQAEQDLKVWARRYIALLSFMENFGTYSQPEVWIKYIYLAVHCSLVVIGLTDMGAADMINDLFLTVTVTIGNFWVLFYATRKIDTVTKENNDIFLDAYAKCWFLLPLKEQRTLRLIQRGITNTTYKMKLFKIYYDDSESIMAVLQLAAQALTFVVSVAQI